MAQGFEVLEMLLPDGGWIINGNDYDGIVFLDCQPITKKEFEDGFAKYDAWLEQKKADELNQKNKVLNKLGITEEEANFLLS